MNSVSPIKRRKRIPYNKYNMLSPGAHTVLRLIAIAVVINITFAVYLSLSH
ncbi:MAG: hypothetical protein PF440_01100 [Thiomicrorhabdus sp.]|jgi:hypothetical protein|nr:hypothetical protein [Thiomicrorhabdus sp.]